MSDRGRKSGPRCKPKAGLTPAEQAVVDRMAGIAKAMWEDLFARNKWRPIK